MSQPYCASYWGINLGISVKQHYLQEVQWLRLCVTDRAMLSVTNWDRQALCCLTKTTEPNTWSSFQSTYKQTKKKTNPKHAQDTQLRAAPIQWTSSSKHDSALKMGCKTNFWTIFEQSCIRYDKVITFFLVYFYCFGTKFRTGGFAVLPLQQDYFKLTWILRAAL